MYVYIYVYSPFLSIKSKEEIGRGIPFHFERIYFVLLLSQYEPRIHHIQRFAIEWLILFRMANSIYNICIDYIANTTGHSQPKCALNLHLICTKKVQIGHWIWWFGADVAHYIRPLEDAVWYICFRNNF